MEAVLSWLGTFTFDEGLLLLITLCVGLYFIMSMHSLADRRIKHRRHRQRTKEVLTWLGVVVYGLFYVGILI